MNASGSQAFFKQAPPRFFAPDGEAVAPVARREQSAERHDEASAPDPVDERLVLHLDEPGAVGERIAERDVKIAGEAGVNGRLGHHLFLHGIGSG